MTRFALTLLSLLTLSATAEEAAAPVIPVQIKVRFETSLGPFVAQLDADRAPLSVGNFLRYVREGFYDGTIFHRVLDNFVAQGGGYGVDNQLKPVHESIPNESGNGLTNRRGTLGMARSEGPHSANSQFYINLADNAALNPVPTRWGYAVFGEVIEGMDVVDRLGHVATGAVGPFKEAAPLRPIVIQKVSVIE